MVSDIATTKLIFHTPTHRRNIRLRIRKVGQLMQSKWQFKLADSLCQCALKFFVTKDTQLFKHFMW